MTEPHGIYGIVMVLGVLLGVALLFFGSRMERYLGYIRSISVVGLLFSAMYLSIAMPENLLPAMQGNIGLGGLWKLVVASPNTLHILLKVAAFLLAIVWGTLAQRFFPQVFEAFSMLVVYSSLSALVFIEGWITFSVVALPITALILSIAVSGFRVFHTTLFRALESAICGSLLISYLFTRFYYLPRWIFLLLFVILGAAGSLTQILYLKKKVKNHNVMSGKETV